MFVISLNAQEKGKIRFGLDAGMTLPGMGAGFSGDMDLRYNILDNLNLGVKFGGAFMLKELNASEASASAIMNISSIGMLHGDYYFNKGTNMFAPFVGAGIGSFSLLNIYIADTSSGNYTYDNVPLEKKIGGMLRGGFELGHFRLALEYYIIPSST